jgi:hypothetical protein
VCLYVAAYAAILAPSGAPVSSSLVWGKNRLE